MMTTTSPSTPDTVWFPGYPDPDGGMVLRSLRKRADLLGLIIGALLLMGDVKPIGMRRPRRSAPDPVFGRRYAIPSSTCF